MIMVELLAPAGSPEALKAAVESGANAVYLAGQLFGARAYASNFDEEGLREAIRYAHLRGVLINVTVNTIVADEEMQALRSYLEFLYEAGADAVLVQDLGVAKIAREIVPGLPLHASTQMTVHSLEGVLALQKLGFTRVVLAREMSLKEIRYICAHADVEIEVFMHGALCVCYSGQCLMSSMIGGRSGNRGRCAQPCRLPYTLVDERGKDVLGDKAGSYLLSPRDLNTIDLIPELIDAGVASLKIEGRMKRPEYVATVVSTYRNAIDRHLFGEGYSVQQQERDRLTQIFNRDFTTAYLLDRPGKMMMSDRRPNNRGLLAGRVVKFDRNRQRVTVKLSAPLAAGDQVDFWVKVGGRVTSTIREMTDAQGRTVSKANSGETVSFELAQPVGERRETVPREHDRLFKVYDAELMAEAKHSYTSGAPIRRIGLTARIFAAVGKPMQIVLRDAEGHQAEAHTDFIAEPARKRPLTEETVRKQIDRLGTSVFELTDCSVEIEGDVMVPVSAINEARRTAVEELERQRLAEMAPYAPRRDDLPPWPAASAAAPDPARLMVSVDSLDKMQAALEGGADGILFGGESYAHSAIGAAEYHAAWELAQQKSVRIDFNTPRIVKMSAQQALEELLQDWQEYFHGAVHVHNIGTLALVRRLTSLPVHGDYSLVSFNVQTLKALQGLGVAEATLSPELNLKQVETIASQSPLPLTCIVHGRLELMVSEYCVTGSFLGNVGEQPCSQPCKRGRYGLKDRKEAMFPLAMDQYCRMHVLNSKILSMLPHVMKFRRLGVQTLRLEAKALSPAEIKRITRAYSKALSLPEKLDEAQQAWAASEEGTEFTRGHYFRGVM